MQMAWRHASERRTHAWVAAVGLALGVFILAFMGALGLGVRRWVLGEIVRAVPVDMVKVVPKVLDFGIMRLPGAGILGGRPLDAATWTTLSALPGVAAAYPEIDVALPISAQGGARLFGRNLRTDLFLTALPEALVQSAACPDFVDHWAQQGAPVDQAIPLVLSPQLIDLYNATVATAMGTPQLTAQTLVGFEFDLVIGRSVLLGSQGARRQGIERARIVGVSPFAARLGATLPMGAARWLAAKYALSPAAASNELYSSILLRAHSPQEIVTVTDGVLRLGLDVDRQAQHIRDLLWAATALMVSVALLVVALATSQTALCLYFYVAQRRRQFALLQALGLRWADVVALILVQAIGLGVLGGLCGMACARSLAAACDALLHYLWPQTPFVPLSLFDFTGRWDSICMLVAVGSAILGAVGPARRATPRVLSADLQR